MKNTKIGDVFSVKISEQHKKYFQYISNDLIQLNSDVIRAFKKVYLIKEMPDVSEIIKDEVEFYAHCATIFGIKFKLWEKVGNISEVGKVDSILFRDTNDYGYKIGQEPIKVSNNWHVWRITDKDFRKVGKLEGENKDAEIGLVMNPREIVHRMKTGTYEMMENYPSFG